MEHVIDGYVSRPKKSCFLAFSIYWPCLSFSRQVFCEFVIFLFVQESLESLLSTSSLLIHLSMFGNCVAIVSRFVLLSCFVLCLSRNLIGPLSGVSSMECH